MQIPIVQQMVGRHGSFHSRTERISSKLIVLFLFIVFFSFLTGSHLQAQTAIDSATTKIDPSLIMQAERNGSVAVVIALAGQTVSTDSQADATARLTALQTDVAVLQQGVLDTLAPDDFQLKARYRAVPALAGIVTPAGLAKLAGHPDVRKIDLDVGGVGHQEPKGDGGGNLASSVPFLGANRWHSRNITGTGIVVAVIDSGLDSDHSDLSDDLIHEACFLDTNGTIDGTGSCPNGSDRQTGAGSAEDDHGHGTHVTGIVTSGGVQSAVGMAPGADIVSIKVLDSTNSFFFFSEIVAALDYIINNRPDVQVINMSLGTGALFAGACDNSTAFNMAGAAAVNTLRANGVIIFASSANDGSSTQMSSPACLSNVVSVGATDLADNVAGFTNSNATLDLLAPGVSIVSSGLGNGTANFSGTSMASPHAAGCAALLLQSGTVTTPAEVEARLESSTIQVTDTRNGLTFPRLDCNPPPPVLDVIRPGFDTSALPPNDDSSTGLVPIGFDVNFFGTTYSSLYVNNNGNVTFDSPLATYTPFGLIGTERVIIAPFFADVDTRTGNVTRYSTGTVDGSAAFGVTWVEVGCFQQNVSVLNSFQVVLIDRSAIGTGDFDIEFNYDQIQWEAGTASGGDSNCLGGDAVRVGYSNGINTFFELPGSNTPGAFLDSNLQTGLIHNSRDSFEPGRYLFKVRNGSAPIGGSIAGTISTNTGTPVADALIQLCSNAGFCNVTAANSLGQYGFSALTAGSYTLTAFPPTGSTLQTASLGPISLAENEALTGQDLILTALTGPPTGTTITNIRTTPDGVPVVFWNENLTLTTQGCAGAGASYELRQGGTVIGNGTLTEGPAGTYTATIPALFPVTGFATVRINLNCPGGATEQTEFNIYIDPSGHVRTVDGTPIANATVTLYRADSQAGPFEPVPNGSAIMSPANRTNPDTTDTQGRFGWDVIAGYYFVRAAAPGCFLPAFPTQEYVDSPILPIPPPVTDLDLRLSCPATLQPGDCNGDAGVNAGDITALILEVFDGDNAAVGDVGGGTFPGTPQCDANQDTQINAADISCTVLRIFGASSCAAAATGAVQSLVDGGEQANTAAEVTATQIFLPSVLHGE